MSVQELRNSLPITQSCIYMNTGQASPTPLAVLRRIGEALEQEAREGPGTINGLAFSQAVEEKARISVADFINADPDDIKITHNSREGIYVVLYGINWQPGDEILICDLEHSSISKPAAVLAQRFGVKIVQPNIPPLAPQREVVDIIKAALSSKTRLAALSHIQYGCGLRMPIKEIARVIREKGGLLLVDGAQSVGQIAVNVSDLECDFYACSGQKWLMGPVGTGALYVHRNHRGVLEPLFTTNTIEAHRRPKRSYLARFAIAPLNPGLVAGATEAIRLISDIGIKRIEERVMSLATLLQDGLASIPGIMMLSPHKSSASASGLVTIGFNAWQPDNLVEKLQTQFGIVARAVHTPRGVRFCTAYFNTEQEVGRVVAVIKRLAKESYKTF